MWPWWPWHGTWQSRPPETNSLFWASHWGTDLETLGQCCTCKAWNSQNTESARHCKALQGTARHQCTANLSRSMKHQNCVTMESPVFCTWLHHCCSSQHIWHISTHPAATVATAAAVTMAWIHRHTIAGWPRESPTSRTRAGAHGWTATFPMPPVLAREFRGFLGKTYCYLLLRVCFPVTSPKITKQSAVEHFTISFWQFEWCCRWQNLSQKLRKIHGITLRSDGVQSGGLGCSHSRCSQFLEWINGIQRTYLKTESSLKTLEFDFFSAKTQEAQLQGSLRLHGTTELFLSQMIHKWSKCCNRTLSHGISWKIWTCKVQSGSAKNFVLWSNVSNIKKLAVHFVL